MPSKKYRKKLEKEAKNKLNENKKIDINENTNSIDAKELHNHMKRKRAKKWKRANNQYNKR